VDAIEHVSTKHLQVLNVQTSIDDTNHHALEVFHVLNTNVDFVDVREVDVKPNEMLNAFGHPFCNIVMTFLVRECYGSPKKQEFYRILIGKQCNLVNIRS